MQTWFERYWFVILFYFVIILLIYIYRKRFQFEGKIVALYKTKVGLKLMDKFGKKFDSFIRVIFSIMLLMTIICILMMSDTIFKSGGQVWKVGSIIKIIILALILAGELLVVIKPKHAPSAIIGIGFAGMLLMVYFIGLGTYQLFFQPTALPLFSPILPGISIPGSPVTLPLIEGIIALFLVVVVHEFTHGILARAYGIKVKSSGLVMMGPIPGAFVEPDEKKLQKAKPKAQLAIFAGGPFANVLLSLVIIALIFLIAPLSASLYSADGIQVNGFTNQSENAAGGRLASLSEGEIILSVNNVSIKTLANLSYSLQNKSPGDVVVMNTDKGSKNITLDARPENLSQPYLGIYLNNHVKGNNEVANNVVFMDVYFWLFGNPYAPGFDQLGLLMWVFLISLGVGIVNLLPIGPMDGGRMYLVALEKFFSKDAAHRIWKFTFAILVFLLAILIIVPIVRAIF